MTKFANITQDGVQLEVEFEIHGFGTAAARLEIHDILHKGESINALLVSLDPADPLMVMTEQKTVWAWLSGESDVTRDPLHLASLHFTAQRMIDRIREEAAAVAQRKKQHPNLKP